MLHIYKGIYENGQVILDEKPDVKIKSKVIVTFLDENDFENEPTTEKRILGGFHGKIKVPENFDEPLDDLNEYML